MKYNKGIGAGLGTLAGGGLDYLAATKALGKKEDFIAKTLRKYPGITKTAAEEIYKDTKKKYLLRGIIGGAVAGAGAGLLIGDRFRNKTNQPPRPENHIPIQTQPNKKESPLSELENGLSNFEREAKEARSNLDQHKANIGKDIIERHNEAAKKVNDTVQKINDRANQQANDLKNKEKVDNKEGLDEIESLIDNWK